MKPVLRFTHLHATKSYTNATQNRLDTPYIPSFLSTNTNKEIISYKIHRVPGKQGAGVGVGGAE